MKTLSKKEAFKKALKLANKFAREFYTKGGKKNIFINDYDEESRKRRNIRKLPKGSI